MKKKATSKVVRRWCVVRGEISVKDLVIDGELAFVVPDYDFRKNKRERNTLVLRTEFCFATKARAIASLKPKPCFWTDGSKIVRGMQVLRVSPIDGQTTRTVFDMKGGEVYSRHMQIFSTRFEAVRRMRDNYYATRRRIVQSLRSAERDLARAQKAYSKEIFRKENGYR